MPNTNTFELALKDARKALDEAYELRSAVEQRIVRLKQTIDGLASLCEPEASEDLLQVKGDQMPEGHNTSLTDAIRRIFSETSEPMLTPPEVRDALLAMGVNLAKYKQPLVPIHNTLKRLETQGELIAFTDDAGDIRGYRWVSPLARAVAEVGRNRPMEELEKQTILNALRQVNGEKMPVARLLGIGKTALYRKLKEI
jgi:DNA-binding NtrC family response regulator